MNILPENTLFSIHSKEWEKLAAQYFRKFGIILKTQEQIEGIRQASLVSTSILNATCKMAKEGVTTLELNDFAHKMHLELGATPAPLGFGEPPFPKSICTSVNDVICHGIPDKTKLQNGDIVNIDITSAYKGYYGDCSRMVAIGEISEDNQFVMDVAYECLMSTIKLLKPGIPLSLIGAHITKTAKKYKCQVVSEFSSHGIGLSMHEPPEIVHFPNDLDIILVPGMTFTIEPMINIGSRKAKIDPQDGWTARTIDGKPSAQWEHTLLITETGCDILTPWELFP